MASRTLTIEIVGDPASASRAFRKVGSDAERMGKDVDKSGGKIRGFATVTSKGFGRVGLAAGGMAAAGAGAAALLSKSFVSGATAINESLSKNQVLFGEYAGRIDQFSKRSAAAFGISRQAALEATGTFGNLFVALDIGPKKSAGMSVALTKLAADLASFNNASPEEALEAIRSGLVGETEPLRRFGVNLNDATLRTQALKMGLIDTVKNALTPQQKALAVNRLLFEQTGKAQGDFARTSGGLANQQRILKARLADAGAELGAKLMPIVLRAVKGFNSLFDETSKGGRIARNLSDAYVKYLGFVRGALQDAVAAVRRFADRNREEIRQVIETFRRIGVAARAVFEDVLIPVVKRVLPVVRGMAEGIVTALRGLMRVVTGLINGDWKRAWNGVKDIARGAVRAVDRLLTGLSDAFRDAIKALAPVVLSAGKAVGRALAKGVADGIKSTVTGKGGGVIADALRLATPGGLGSVIGKAVGDGIGRTIGPSLSVGGLDGADPDLAPFAAVGGRFGLHVSSGMRPGAITSTGNPSFHGTGDAIDMSGPAGGMLSTFRTLKKTFGPRLRELIYTPGGAGIKDGRSFTYTGQVAADHHDHVHVAYTGPFGDGIGDATRAASRYWKGDDLVTAVAVAGPESTYRDAARLVTSQEDSRGMWQVNTLAHPWAASMNLRDTNAAAGAAFRVWSQAGRSWSPWTGFTSGNYRNFLSRARAAVAALGRAGGAPGASGGGGGTANIGAGARGAFQGAQREARGQAREAVGSAREEAREERAAARELPAARLGVRRAKAEARDDLSGLIKVMVEERAAKRRRLKAIRKVLKRRINKKRRVRLLNEEAELIAEIGDLTDSIKEYKADQAGGATTITRAEELDAGVDPGAQEGEAGAADAGGAGAAEPAAVAEPDPNIAILAGLVAEQVQNQRRILALAQQGPAILAAVVAAVNGDIGGKVGIGFSTPGYAGATARY